MIIMKRTALHTPPTQTHAPCAVCILILASHPKVAHSIHFDVRSGKTKNLPQKDGERETRQETRDKTTPYSNEGWEKREKMHKIPVSGMIMNSIRRVFWAASTYSRETRGFVIYFVKCLMFASLAVDVVVVIGIGWTLSRLIKKNEAVRSPRQRIGGCGRLAGRTDIEASKSNQQSASSSRRIKWKRLEDSFGSGFFGDRRWWRCWII